MQNPSFRCCRGNESSPVGENRRGFFYSAAAIVGGTVALLVPTVTGLVSFLNPLREKGPAGRFVRLTLLDALPTDGTPQRVAVVAERRDAWTRFPAEPVGAVFLRCAGNGVTALQVICPHAGCSIDYQSTPEGGRYFCPCHQASFNLEGKRTDANSFSPRDMDALQVEVRNNGEVWVKFENFLTGTSRKIVQG